MISKSPFGSNEIVGGGSSGSGSFVAGGGLVGGLATDSRSSSRSSFGGSGSGHNTSRSGSGGAGTTFLFGRATTPPVASSDDHIGGGGPGGIFKCVPAVSFCQPKSHDTIPWNTNAATNPLNNGPPPMDFRDPILTRELGKLTAEEREKLYEEIHGIVNIPDEEPQFVEECLNQMEVEIQKVKKRAAYNKAHFLAPNKVKSAEFRLMFLRATNFNPRDAAKFIVNHFRNKCELFGTCIRYLMRGDVWS